jgi:hypothetical protein
MKAIRNNEFLDDIITQCAPLIGYETAVRGCRALCRAYPGQNVFIPAKKMNGACAVKLLTVLEEEIGCDAKIIFEKMVAFYGGTLQYIPLERCGFKKDIAKEIYKTLGTTKKAVDFCAEYNIAYTQVYRLWRAGQRLWLEENSPRLNFD